MYTMISLSPQRAAILEFLRERIAAGAPPSLAEIAEAFGFASRNAAQKHVQALVSAGLIELQTGQKRGLRLPGQGDRITALPVLGRVAAGVPIGADIGSDRVLWLDRSLFSLRPDYLLRVEGDSMIDDGILDGDLVGVHRSREARDGQIVVARLDDAITIKRLEHRPAGVRLLPRNRAHAPIVVAADADFSIEGLYCGLLRQG